MTAVAPVIDQQPHGRDEDLMRRWVQDQERRGLSFQTIDRRRAETRHLSRWLEARDVELLDATSELIEDWADDRHVGPQARYSYISYVSAFYRWAVWDRLIDSSPTDRVRRPKLPRHLPRPIADDDLAVALDMADLRTRAMIALGAYAGMRAGEIAGLHRRDVLDRHDPPILVISQGKGSRDRAVPLHPDLWRFLRVYGLPRDGWVFPGRDRTRPLTSRRVTMLISRHFRDCGIDAVPHQLRHWFGSSVYRQSLDLRMTQELLGHAKPETTALYTAYAPRAAGDVVNGLPMLSRRAAGPKCELCHRTMPASSDRFYCSDRCRIAADLEDDQA